MTAKDFLDLAGRRGMLTIRRDDTGEVVQVLAVYCRPITLDRVYIHVPGHEGTGTVIRETGAN